MGKRKKRRDYGIGTMIGTGVGLTTGLAVQSGVEGAVPAGATKTAISRNVGSGYKIASTGTILAGAGGVIGAVRDLGGKKKKKKGVY